MVSPQHALNPKFGQEEWHAAFEEFRARSEELLTLGKNWDSHGSEAPNQTSVRNAKRFLDLLEEERLIPSKVSPSVEGGTAVVFVLDRRYADIEFFNDGDIVCGLSLPEQPSEVWEVENSTEAMKSAIRRIRDFLAA